CAGRAVVRGEGSAPSHRGAGSAPRVQLTFASRCPRDESLLGMERRRMHDRLALRLVFVAASIVMFAVVFSIPADAHVSPAPTQTRSPSGPPPPSEAPSRPASPTPSESPSASPSEGPSESPTLDPTPFSPSPMPSPGPAGGRGAATGRLRPEPDRR